MQPLELANLMENTSKAIRSQATNAAELDKQRVEVRRLVKLLLADLLDYLGENKDKR